MTYQLFLDRGNPSDGISRHNDDGSTSYIPNNPDNRDWVEYQKWLNAVDENGDSLNNQPDAA